MKSLNDPGAARLSGRGVAALILMACAAPMAAAQTPCTDLAGLAIPAGAIGLPTTGGAVNAATLVPSAGSGTTLVAEYCRVDARISPVDPSAPNILFRVALPTACWPCRCRSHRESRKRSRT